MVIERPAPQGMVCADRQDTAAAQSAYRSDIFAMTDNPAAAVARMWAFAVRNADGSFNCVAKEDSNIVERLSFEQMIERNNALVSALAEAKRERDIWHK